MKKSLSLPVLLCLVLSIAANLARVRAQEELPPAPAGEPVVADNSDGISASGAQAGPWSATIYLSNPNDSAASGAILFYETDGSLDATYDFTNIGTSGIPVHGSAVIDVASVGLGALSWQGAAVVQASTQVAAQVALQVNSNTDRMLYSGFSQGSNKVSSPAIACNAFDQDSDLVVMNTGSTDTTFTVTYLSTTGGNEPTTGPHPVKANSSIYLDVCAEVGETGGWLGSATVDAANSSDALVAVVFQPYVVAPKAVAYEALAGAGSNRVFFPTALQKTFTAQFTSFYAIQNVGSSDTMVTLEFFDKDGNSVGTVKTNLALGEKVSSQPQDAGAPTTGFLGSAVATASAGGEIAGITNIGTLPAGGGCPSGAGQTTAFLDPGDRAGDSGAKLAVPWAEYKSGSDWRTFLAVQNVGDMCPSGPVTVTYYHPDGTVAATDLLGSIACGAKANSDPNSAGAGSSFLGSAEVVSANSADRLIGLSNHQQADGCHAASTLAIPFTGDPVFSDQAAGDYHLPIILLKSPSNALYVWRDPDPMRNGTPITLTEAQRLAKFAVAEGIHTIYYDNFGCGSDPDCPPGAEQQNSSDLAPIISLLHSHDLRVEALYTDNTRILDVVNYNNTVQANERFDGIRLNIEAFPSGSPEPTTPDDLDVYTQAVSDAQALPVYISISHHWDDLINYKSETKEAYKHILDIVTGVDVQTAQDKATIIAIITKEEVCYANSIGKPVHITIETYDVVTHEDLEPHNTFYEEGEAAMKAKLAILDYTAPGVNASCNNPVSTGFAYHFYRQSYGSPDIPGWETHVD